MFAVECLLHAQKRHEQQRQSKGLEELTQKVFDEYSRRFHNDSLFRMQEVQKAHKAHKSSAVQRRKRHRLDRVFPFK